MRARAHPGRGGGRGEWPWRWAFWLFSRCSLRCCCSWRRRLTWRCGCLIDLNANAQREEITMEPLMAADTPDEPKILAQIDKIAQARAELEKANARFLLGIRRVLTQEQWQKLRAEM